MNELEKGSTWFINLGYWGAFRCDTDKDFNIFKAIREELSTLHSRINIEGEDHFSFLTSDRKEAEDIANKAKAILRRHGIRSESVIYLNLR